MRIDIYHHFPNDREGIEKILGRLDGLAEAIGCLNQQGKHIMIDTKALLDAVRKQKTETASLLQLVAAQKQVIAEKDAALQKAKDDLAAAIAANDPAAMAQIQTDLDNAANDLGLDDNDVASALSENVPTGGGDPVIVKDDPA